MNKELLRGNLEGKATPGVRTLVRYIFPKRFLDGVQLLSHYLQECTEKRVEYFTCNVDEWKRHGDTPFADSVPIFFLMNMHSYYILLPIVGFVGIFYESPPFLNLLCQWHRQQCKSRRNVHAQLFGSSRQTRLRGFGIIWRCFGDWVLIVVYN